jgi:LPS O-antigen subunit length determinant protein (WzzB/FepE family)
MSPAEVPLEQTQEDLLHHAHGATENWIMGVALTAALLAVCAAVAALLAEHHANEALIHQIQSSDLWNFYQAKSIKGHLITTKTELLKRLHKAPDEQDVKDLEKDVKDLEKYEQEKEQIKKEAEEKQAASQSHLRQHSILARSVTMFQVAIAVGAVSVLTRRKEFWFVSLAFGAVGVLFLLQGLLTV